MFGIWKPQYRHFESIGNIRRTEAIDLEVLTVGDSVYKIQFFLGGDMKFLAVVCGIQAFKQQHLCTLASAQNINEVLNGPLQIKQKGHALSKKSPKTVS